MYISSMLDDDQNVEIYAVSRKTPEYVVHNMVVDRFLDSDR